MLWHYHIKLECINTKKLFCSLDCNIAKHVFLCFDSIVYSSIVYTLRSRVDKRHMKLMVRIKPGGGGYFHGLPNQNS